MDRHKHQDTAEHLGLEVPPRLRTSSSHALRVGRKEHDQDALDRIRNVVDARMREVLGSDMDASRSRQRFQAGEHPQAQPPSPEGLHRSKSERERLIQAATQESDEFDQHDPNDMSSVMDYLKRMKRPIPFSAEDQATLLSPKSHFGKGVPVSLKIENFRQNRFKAPAYKREWKSISKAMPLNGQGPLVMFPTHGSSEEWYHKDEEFMRDISRVRTHQAWNPKGDLPKWDELQTLQKRMKRIKHRQLQPLHGQDKMVLDAEMRFLENEVRKAEFKIKVSDEERIYQAVRPFYDTKLGKAIIGTSAIVGASGTGAIAAGSLKAGFWPKDAGSKTNGTVPSNATQPGL